MRASIGEACPELKSILVALPEVQAEPNNQIQLVAPVSSELKRGEVCPECGHHFLRS